MGNAPSLERAMRAAPELASEHGLELNRFSKKQAAASTGAMSRYVVMLSRFVGCGSR